MNDDIHVTPVGDLIPHVDRRDCWCQPTPDADEPRVVVHHSADEREQWEGPEVGHA
jgi:hypothetical protein